MAQSDRLRDIVRDITVGMTDEDVADSTDMSLGTWRRLKKGIVVEDDTLLKFATGMRVDLEPLRVAAAEKRPGLDKLELVGRALAVLGLTPGQRMEVMQHIRSLLGQRNSEEKAA